MNLRFMAVCACYSLKWRHTFIELDKSKQSYHHYKFIWASECIKKLTLAISHSNYPQTKIKVS